MLTEFRAAIRAIVDETGLPVHKTIPDDVAHLPCVVVGRPSAGPGDSGVVFDVDLDLFVLGRRHNDSTSDDELVADADVVLTTFGGTRGRPSDFGLLTVDSIDARQVEVAHLTTPAYVLSISGSATICTP